MKIREHTPAPAGWCLWCGAYPTAAGVWEATCLEREDHAGHLMPEPKRREYACEDRDAISARLEELRKETAEAWNADKGV